METNDLSDLTVDVEESGTGGVAEALVAGVRLFNAARVGPADSRPLCVVARDAGGTLRGGVSGRTVYDHFLIEVVWVDDACRGRGLGQRLMEAAEARAKARGCVAAQVDTLSFQAPGFYAKLGFAVVGTIEDFPSGHSRYFLLKRYAVE